jgi:hypothetical protein
MNKALVAFASVVMLGTSIAPLSVAGASASTRHRFTAVGVGQGGARAAFPTTPTEYNPPVSPNLSGPTVKDFTETEQSGGRNFTIKQVGTFPGTNTQSTIPVKVIPVAFHFSDGVTIDPTATLPSCAGGGTALNRTLNSVIYKPVQTTSDGKRQWTEEFRRSEYFNFSKPGGTGQNNSVKLSPSVLPKITINVNGPSVAEACGRGGNVTINSLQNTIQTSVFASLWSKVKTTDFAMFLWGNIVMCQTASASTCGINGFHTAFERNGGTQTYGVTEFATDRRFHNTEDTSIASHEVAEWFDDPFGNNPTPTWGHIGQVTGCQSNYEPGDPLTGTLFTVGPSHVQDLAEFSWFYRVEPSLGRGGLYSLFGTFRSPSVPCS